MMLAYLYFGRGYILLSSSLVSFLRDLDSAINILKVRNDVI